MSFQTQNLSVALLHFVVALFSFQGTLSDHFCDQIWRSNLSVRSSNPTTNVVWWARVGSNHRPCDYQSHALASWATGPFWWRLAGSNRWPPACKAGALPAELNPHMNLFRFSIPENDTGSRRRTVNCQTLRLVFFSFTHFCVSTWDEAIWFLFSLSP